MIVAGFIGQFKGWWDNYLSEGPHTTTVCVVKVENSVPHPNVVYTLVLKIIEYCSGRWSNNSETFRTML